jgi:hypothetical protein
MVAIVPQANTQPIGEKRVTLRGLNWQADQQILHALDREDLDRGSEPDCAYYIQN